MNQCKVSGEFTIQPSGVVLVGPHGRLLSQGSEDSRVCPHEINVDPRVQLSICQAQREQPRLSHRRCHGPVQRFQVKLKERVWMGPPEDKTRISGRTSSCVCWFILCVENEILQPFRLSSSRVQMSCLDSTDWPHNSITVIFMTHSSA